MKKFVPLQSLYMVDVVQLVEHRIVVPSVVGSSPIIHPKQALPENPGAFLVFQAVIALFLARDGGWDDK